MDTQQPNACNHANEGTRIPLSLQVVFLTGNRGREVNAPPPDASAMKVFRRTNAQGGSRWWPFRSWSSSAASSPNAIAVVLASVDTKTKTKTKTKKPVTTRKVKRSKSAPEPSLSPQDYLDGLMHSRGYSSSKYATLLSGYYNKPTQLQLASYGVYVVDMIREGNTEAVQEVLKLGLSPNACNMHGESIVHNVCRRSDILMLDVLLRAGCDIQVSDDNGRTPLHDACWAPEPNFPLIEKLLERDKQLLYMMDSRGHLPLSYTRKHHWSEWLQFLQSKKDVYWPRGGSTSCSIEESGLPFSGPNSRPIRNPDVSFAISLTRMVAGGKLTPIEAQFMQREFQGKQSAFSFCNNEDDNSDFSDDSDDEEESIVSASTVSESSTAKEQMHDSWNFEEMSEILNSLMKPNRAPLAW